MRLHPRIICAIALALLVPSVVAQAVNLGDPGAESAFSGKEGGYLVMGPGPDNTEKTQVMIGLMSDTDDKNPQIAFFNDAATWAGFAAIWKKAMTTPPPAKGADGILLGVVKGAGDFFTVYKYDNGNIDFGMGPGTDNQHVFALDPSLFAAFDTKVDEISKALGQ